jgi:hypothetical protein
LSDFRENLIKKIQSHVHSFQAAVIMQVPTRLYFDHDLSITRTTTSGSRYWYLGIAALSAGGWLAVFALVKLMLALS